MKKAKGAGICPSTGTGSAFLEKKNYGIRKGILARFLPLEEKEKGQETKLSWST